MSRCGAFGVLGTRSAHSWRSGPDGHHCADLAGGERFPSCVAYSCCCSPQDRWSSHVRVRSKVPVTPGDPRRWTVRSTGAG